MHRQHTAQAAIDASAEAPDLIDALDLIDCAQDFLRAAQMASGVLCSADAGVLFRVINHGMTQLAEGRQIVEFAATNALGKTDIASVLPTADAARMPTADAASHAAVAGAAPDQDAGNVGPEQPSSVLMELIETFRGIRGRRKLLDAQIAAILTHPECPALPRLALAEFVGRPRDYRLDGFRTEFASTGQLMVEFGKLLRHGGRETAMTRRIRSDLETGRRLMLERERLHEEWITAQGYPLIVSEAELFFSKEGDLETRICDFPCVNAADLLLKVDFARRYLTNDGVDYVWQNAAIIQSAFGFLTKDGGADANATGPR